MKKMKKCLAILLAVALALSAVVFTPLTVDAAPTDAARVFRFDGSFDGAVPVQIGPFPTATPYGGTANAPTFVTDRHGNANGAVHFGADVGLFLGEGIINSAEYTVALWVNPDEGLVNSFGSLFFGAVAGDNWISLHPASYLGGNSNVALWSGAYAGRWSDNISDVNLMPGVWQHIAFVVRGGYAWIYFNGQPAGMTAQNVPYAIRDLFGPNSPYEGNGFFFLAMNYFPDPVFQGAVDDLYMFNRALSSAEILELSLPATVTHTFRFNNSLDGAVPSQVGPFPTATPYGGTENAPTFVADRHGNANAAVHLGGEVGLFLGRNLITSADYTVAMWVNASYPLNNSFGSLFYGAVTDDNWISLHPASNLAGGGSLSVWSGAGGGRWSDNASEGILTPGTWHHVAMVIANGVATIYLDGVAQAMRVYNAPYALRDIFSPDAYYQLPGYFFLGLNYFPDPVFHGAVDDLYIINRALSSSEVVALMNAPDLSLAHVFTFNNAFDGAVPVGQGPFPTMAAYGGGTGYAPVFVADRHGNPYSAVQFQRASGYDGVGLFLGENLITARNYTVAMWVHPDYPLNNTFGSLFFGAVEGDNWISFKPAAYIGGGSIGLWSGGGGGRWSDNWSDAYLVPGQWQHVALVVEDLHATIYLNGVPAALRVEHVPYSLRDLFSPESAYQLPGYFFLGRNYFGGDPVFAGAVDDLVILNHALNAQGIQALMGMTFAADAAADEPAVVDMQPVVDMLLQLSPLDNLAGLGFTTLAPRWAEAQADAQDLIAMVDAADWMVGGRVAYLETNWLPFVGAMNNFIQAHNQASANPDLAGYLQEIIPYIQRANNMLQVQALVNRLTWAQEAPPAAPAPAPAATPTPADDSDGMNVGLIVGIAAGAVVVVGAGLFFLLKKKK